MNIRVRYTTIEFDDVDIHLRVLRDKQEFEDEQGVAEGLGISSAEWAFFGVVWDSGRALARLLHSTDVGSLRVLEVGCGIGLTSLLLNHADTDVSATDRHPEAQAFLTANTRLNGDSAIPFLRLDWSDTPSALGRFDLILASDVLYAPEHTALVAAFVDQHARPTCEVIVVDPGRGRVGRFSRDMAERGYAHSDALVPITPDLSTGYHGRIHRFRREAEVA